jgi:hypothetical protein
MVSIFIAADKAEADEVQEVLLEAGFVSTLEPAESLGIGSLGVGPCRVLVDATVREAALEVLANDGDEEEDDDGW